MTPLRSLILIVWLALLLLSSGFAYWYFFVRVTVDQDTAEGVVVPNNPFLTAVALTNSTAYEELRVYTSLGDYGKVDKLYIELKTLYATGTPERDVVDFDHAFFTTFPYGKPLEGVGLLKDIVKGTDDYAALTRALAEEAVGRAVTGFNDPAVTAVAFEGEPLAHLLMDANGDSVAALDSLYEESLRLYPTPRAAARVAQARARLLLDEKATLTSQESEALRQEFDNAILQGEQSLVSMQAYATFNDYVGSYKGLQAMAYATRYYATADEADKARAEALFKESIALTQRSTQVFAYYNYALFLEKSGSTPQEIDSIISHITEVPVSTQRLFRQSITNALQNQDSAGHADTMRLREGSPAFKAYVDVLTNTDAAS